jgi:esterase/lipase superfamily enzyme
MAKACIVAVLLTLALCLPGCLSPGLPDSTDNISANPENHSLPIFIASARKGETAPLVELAADKLRYSLQLINIPPAHEPGRLERPALGEPDPLKHFALIERRALSEEAFTQQLANHISGRTGSNRDILLYIHGFNTSYDEARFRLAQIVEDGRFGGVSVLFTWPATGSLLDYGAAKENATASRDALAKLIKELSAIPGSGRIHILGHSMGTWLVMEALRQNAILGDADLNGKLGDIMLAAPDIDLLVFKEQAARLDTKHISIFVSTNDRALSLSRSLTGNRPRLGGLDPRRPGDAAALARLGVKTYDLSALSTGLTGHGTYADAPQVVRQIGQQLASPRLEDAHVQAVLGERPVDERIIATPLPPPPSLQERPAPAE